MRITFSHVDEAEEGKHSSKKKDEEAADGLLSMFL